MARRVCLSILFSSFLFAGFGQEGELSLTFIGDIMAHDVNFRMTDYNAIYANVKEYFENDDLTFANLEFPIVEDLPFASYPNFNAQSSYIRAALRAHIEVFSIANNHTLDKGELGVLKTLGSLILLREEAKSEMYYSGIRGDVNKPFSPVTIHKNGFKIGFLAITQFLNIPQTTPYIHVIDYMNKDEAGKFVTLIKSIASQYDLFILSYHGDNEYTLAPHAEKVKFFRALARAGVHIIWAHHPHVLQPYEILEVDGSKRLIMYSLGNFISGQGYYVSSDTPTIARAYTGDSALLRVTASRSVSGRMSVTQVSPVLISNYTTPSKDIIVDKLETLAASPLYGNWQNYYTVRLGVMRDFIKNMNTYLTAE